MVIYKNKIVISLFFIVLVVLYLAASYLVNDKNIESITLSGQEKNKKQGEKGEKDDLTTISMPVVMSKTPVIGIYIDSFDISYDSRKPKVILLVWKDGNIIWSKNEIRGGPPYFKGKIPEKQVSDFLSLIDAKGLYDSNFNNESYVFIDSTFTKIVIFPDANYLELNLDDILYKPKHHLKLFEVWSSHEIYEVNPDVVVTDRGMEVLYSRTRDEVLSQQPDDYINFRKFWSELRGELKKLIPKESEPAGELQFYLEVKSVPNDFLSTK